MIKLLPYYLFFDKYCFTSYMQWMQVILLYSCTWHLSHIQTDTVKALIFGKTFMESIVSITFAWSFLRKYMSG
uniref:Uncharacterized protein n=1 Tax=Salix viminalis TaxID=40686 RepID=A0A6N2MXH8_SALVM